MQRDYENWRLLNNTRNPSVRSRRSMLSVNLYTVLASFLVLTSMKARDSESNVVSSACLEGATAPQLILDVVGVFI